MCTGMRQNFNIAIRDSKRVETIITSNRSLNIKICRCVIAAPRDSKSQNMSLVIFAVSCTKAASWCSVIFIHFQCHVRIPEAGPTQNVCKHLLCRMVGAGWLHAHKHEDILKGRRPCHCNSFKPVSKNNGVQKSTWRRLCQCILCALVCKVRKLGHIILRHKNSI